MNYTIIYFATWMTHFHMRILHFSPMDYTFLLFGLYNYPMLIIHFVTWMTHFHIRIIHFIIWIIHLSYVDYIFCHVDDTFSHADFTFFSHGLYIFIIWIIQLSYVDYTFCHVDDTFSHTDYSFYHLDYTFILC